MLEISTHFLENHCTWSVNLSDLTDDFQPFAETKKSEHKVTAHTAHTLSLSLPL